MRFESSARIRESIQIRINSLFIYSEESRSRTRKNLGIPGNGGTTGFLVRCLLSFAAYSFAFAKSAAKSYVRSNFNSQRRRGTVILSSIKTIDSELLFFFRVNDATRLTHKAPGVLADLACG